MGIINKSKNFMWGNALSIRMRILQGLSWTMFGTGSVHIIGLLTGIFISNYLGLEEFGKYGIIISTIGMLGIFAGMAMGYTATKFVSEYRSTEPEKSGRYIGMTFLVCISSSIIAASILFIFSSFFSRLLFNDASMQNLLRMASPILILFSVNSISRAGLVGLELFRFIAMIEFIHSILRLSFIIMGCILFHLFGVIVGLVLSELITVLIFYLSLRRKCKQNGCVIDIKGSKEEWRILWSFTIPSFLSNIIMNPANWLCNVLIVNLPNGFFHMGILTAARQLQSAVSFIPIRLMNVTLPTMSNLFGKKSIYKHYKLAFYTQLGILGISVAVALPLMILSKYILSFYGTEFIQGYPVLILMLLFGIFYVLERSLAEVLLSQGKSLNKFWIYFSVTILSVILFWFIFLEKGALGYAISLCISHFLGFTVLTIHLFVIAKKDLHSIPPDDKLDYLRASNNE